MVEQKSIELSVIIPAYNIEQYIEKCVNSIVQNIGDNAEILVIDDGSIDSTGKIIDELEKKHNIVKAFHKKNGGLSDARNYGIERAVGNYLMFIDGDDYVDSTILNVFDHLKKGADVVFVGFNVETLTDSKKINYKAEKIVHGNKNIVKKYLAIRTLKNNTCMKIVKRQFILDNKLYFRSGFSEDFEWTGRLFCHLNSVVSTDINYYHYFSVRPGSKMNSFNKQKFYDIINHANTIMQEVEATTQLDKFVVKRIKQYIGFNIISIFRNIKNCKTKQDKMEVEQLLKDNMKFIKYQKSLLLKLFVLGGLIFGFRFMYKFA